MTFLYKGGWFITRTLLLATTASICRQNGVRFVCGASASCMTQQSINYNNIFQKPNTLYSMRCFSSGSEEEKERAWTDIGTEELKEMLGNEDIQLIDVREPEELLDLGRILSSINIPLGTVADALQMSAEDFKIQYGEPKPKLDDGNIVFHCRSGKRSITAMNIAKQLGYMKVRHYYPGILGWLEYHDQK